MSTLNMNRKPFFLLLVTYLAFVSLGLPDGLLGIAWPYMSMRAQVPLESLGVLLVMFTVGYLASSSTSGKLITILPLGRLLAMSCLLTALSLFTYALVLDWYLLCLASLLLGAGGGAIDSSINSFAASRFRASTISWLHAFYGVGATAGPLLMTVLFAHKLAWYNGYLVVAIVQVSLGVLFLITSSKWQVASDESDELAVGGYGATLRLPIVWLYLVIFFLYTGLEQGFGQWIFSVLTHSRGVAEEKAGWWTSTYWGSLTLGRILFGIVLTKLPVYKVLKGAFLGIVAGTFLVAIDKGTYIGLLGIMVLGMANAPVFPCLISVTPLKIGKEHAATAIGMQISLAMLGASLMPGAAGWLANRHGLEVIPLLFATAAVVLMLLYFLSEGRSNKKKE